MESVEGITLSIMERLSIESSSSDAHICEHVLFKEILTRLAMKDLMRLKCVSKGWLARITGGPFAADYFHRYPEAGKPSDLIRASYWLVESEDEDEYGDMVGAYEYLSYPRMFFIGDGESSLVDFNVPCTFFIIDCSNGLVFLRTMSGDGQTQLRLWNPATGELRILPEPIVPVSKPDMNPEPLYDILGIGFEKGCDEYKIVRVEELRAKDEGFEGRTLDVQLFTKSSGCWRRLEVLSGMMILCSDDGRGGVVIDGAIHWAVSRGDLSSGPVKGSLIRLLTFDLHSEELKEMDSPASGSGDDLYVTHLQLITWRGSLGAIMSTAGSFECPVFLKCDGTCWTKMFVIESSRFCQGVFRDEFLLYDLSSTVVLFDPVTKRERNFDDVFENLVFDDFQNHRYVPSLVSPN